MPSSEPGSSRRTSGATGSALALAAALFLPAPALALYGDRVELFAGQNFTWDSNVFRLPDGVDSEPLIGSSDRGDRSSTTSAGVIVDVPYGQQRFRANATGFATRYDRFSDLDFNGHLLRGEWLWAVTSAFTGEAGLSKTRSLSSFSNFQLRQRDIVDSRSAWLNGAWLATPSWRVHAGGGFNRQEHSNEVRALEDLERAFGEAGLSYVNAEGNRIGVALRREEGRRPQSIDLGGVSFDNGYTQDGVGVIGRWTVTGQSALDARFDYIRREYDQFTARDYKGPTYLVSWTWTPTGKLTFLTTLQRDIGPLEDVNTSFVLVQGITVKPTWAITSKIDITGTLSYATWDYRVDPAFGSNVEHKVRTVGLGATWRPLRKLLFTAGWTREKRTSTADFAAYDVDLFLVEGRIGF